MQASSAPARVRINHSKKAMSFLSPTSSVPSHRLHFDLSVARIMGFHIRKRCIGCISLLGSAV
ncbi:MAG: hypothetical protein OXL36_00080 [Bryobacterales bacterium]|nr:hypothetical protein [Bryobacterales bacterium]MDE0292931.1 hypothetical protein [Bryobacterales bacterium]